MTDAVRVVAVLACCINIGVITVLYGRVVRLFPTVWTRLLLTAKVIWLAAGAALAIQRIGEAVSWISPVIAVAAILDLVAVAGLYWYYGTPRGKVHAARILEDE